ncbi:MAG: DUF2148 domain-containing protein [Peptococcaceae bacterium]|nr:DUF2148 domain-containing protein [Peptococcaceae bacterium]MDH7525088.1 DUF2148 domain-containing protein [Peptococcaceae bacterium]
MEENLKDALLKAAEFMAIAARTAPKAAGKDFIQIKIVSGDDLKKLAGAMVEYGNESNKKNFDRDGENVRNSDAVLLLSLAAPQPTGLNCGACGKEKCVELQAVEGPEFKGPLCAWRILDLGIALGSAAKTASIFNLDNRIMYRVGVAARKLGLIEGELAVGIPVSVTGKSIYFDR